VVAWSRTTGEVLARINDGASNDSAPSGR
jgi:hypothetical protein